MGYYISPEHYQIANKNGINEMCVYHRVYVLGWNINRAINEKIRKKKHKNLKELAKKHDIKYSTLKCRLSKGLSLDESLNKKVLSCRIERTKHARKSINRVFSDAELLIAKRNGIPYPTLYQRVKICGWDKSKALNTPILTRKEVSKIANESPYSFKNNPIIYKS